MPSIFIDPTPLFSPIDQPSLSDRINIATRSLHTQLNRLILLRLPLALPPKTTNPSKYISGLLYIAPIYITFESLWESILNSPCEAEEVEEAQHSLKKVRNGEKPDSKAKSDNTISDSYAPQPTFTQKTCSRIHCLLSDLQLPGLARAERLGTDLRVLTGTSSPKIEQQLAAVSQNGKLAEFITHTKRSVDANPHVLLAYAWVLYMALFSGGRHLRVELKKAGGIGPHFWDREPSPVRPYCITQDRALRLEARSETHSTSESIGPSRLRSKPDSTGSQMIPGMQFFNFPGSEDGEDIKRQFKTRYNTAEMRLTETEKEDIISEAQSIFKFMLELINHLDIIMETGGDDLENERLHRSRPRMASQDSVVVTHECLTREATITEKQELYRKASSLRVFGNQPLAKLFQFKGTFSAWDLAMKPLGRRFSKDGPAPQVSFWSGREKTHSYFLVHYLVMLGVMVTVLMAFLAW